MQTIFLILAAVCFGLAAMGIGIRKFGFVPLGLLLWLAAEHFI